MSSPAGAAGPVTRTFFNTGAEQTYSVPPAATSVHVTAIGAPGGHAADGSTGGAGGQGGFGAFVDGEVTVSGLASLFVEVGTPGGIISSGGGFGGAGAGGPAANAGGGGGGGGGASDVRTCSINAVTCAAGSTLQSRMVVAGGGGGGGGGWSNIDAGNGGDAGSGGAPSSPNIPDGGAAGTSSTPCSGGTGGTNFGQNGQLGFGGHGGFSGSFTNFGGGGGGGGGYCGGGGGGAKDTSFGAGGGGGSSFVAVNVVDLPIGVATTRTPSITITYNDATAPAIAFQTPLDGESYGQGRSFAASYTCTDDAGGAGVASCLGTVPVGQPIDTSTVGVHHFSVTATDNVGNSATRTVDYTVVPEPATISNVSETNKRWREGKALPTITSAARKAPVGTTFSVALDRPATVRLPFAVTRRGRVVGRHCVKPTKHNASKPQCHHLVVVGRLTFPGKTGLNRVRFQGRLGRKKRLPLGSYRLVINATTPEQRKTKALPLRFKIVR